MLRSKMLLAAVMAAVLVGLAGCGSSSKNGASSPTSAAGSSATRNRTTASSSGSCSVCPPGGTGRTCARLSTSRRVANLRITGSESDHQPSLGMLARAKSYPPARTEYQGATMTSRENVHDGLADTAFRGRHRGRHLR